MKKLRCHCGAVEAEINVSNNLDISNLKFIKTILKTNNSKRIILCRENAPQNSRKICLKFENNFGQMLFTHNLNFNLNLTQHKTSSAKYLLTNLLLTF